MSQTFFDIINDDFYNTFDNYRHHNYPPVNITLVKPNDNYTSKHCSYFVFDVALAGFKKEDLTIECYDNIIALKGSMDRATSSTDEQPNSDYTYTVVQNGLAKREISENYKFPHPVEVRDAKFEDGILSFKVFVKEPPKCDIVTIN
jgi:HSP20 family molecular chaperone IbpA